MTDVFSDLREWGTILTQLDQLRLAGRLDQHQKGLARLLRYRFNWQLRHAVLRLVPELREPSEEILTVLCQIVTDERGELETRLLACYAVECCIRRQQRRGGASAFEEQAFAEARRILSSPQSPALREAVEKWLQLNPVEDVAQVAAFAG